MGYAYTIRTEDETIFTNILEIQGNFCWVKELKTLFRIVDNECGLQPDAVVFVNEDTLHNLYRVGKFKDSKAAFSCMDHNTEILHKAMKELAEMPETQTFPKILESPKTYCACYMFNYFGGEKVGDKMIDGAGIYVAFRPYKDGKLIQFRSEKETYFSETITSRLIGPGRKKNIYFSDAVEVSYDRENCYQIDVNQELVKIICDHFGWDRLSIEVESVCLYYTARKYISEEFQCGNDVFERFLKEHQDDFDISDNRSAQCPGYCWVKK